jgi:hypothetical protein
VFCWKFFFLINSQKHPTDASNIADCCPAIPANAFILAICITALPANTPITARFQDFDLMLLLPLFGNEC